MTMTTPSPTPSAESAAPQLQIGAFSGYNRRPLPDKSGLTAQFYGENGDDADMISALSLTKFLEADVYVKIHLIKDSFGKIMRAEDGRYPLIAQFSGKIQRPKPQRDGMIANFFAANGDDADQINELGLSKYLDAFVYVEILKPEAAPQPNAPTEAVLLPSPQADLDALALHLTPAERKALAKRSKAFQEANRLLKMSGFLNQPAVWSCLGSELEFQTWLDDMPCCAPGDQPCAHKAKAFKIPAESHQRYSMISFCPEHAAQAESGALPGGIAFMRLRRQVLIQEWAWEALRSVVGTPQGIEEPDPQKVMSWALEHKLSQYVPPNYLNKF